MFRLLASYWTLFTARSPSKPGPPVRFPDYDEIQFTVQARPFNREDMGPEWVPYSMVISINGTPTALESCNFKELYKVLHYNVKVKPFQLQSKCWGCRQIESVYTEKMITWKTSFPNSGYTTCHRAQSMTPPYCIDENVCPLKEEMRHFVYHINPKVFRKEIQKALTEIKKIYRTFFAQYTDAYALDQIEDDISKENAIPEFMQSKLFYDCESVYEILWILNAEVAEENVSLEQLSEDERNDIRYRYEVWQAKGKTAEAQIRAIELHNRETILLAKENVPPALSETIRPFKTLMSTLLRARDRSETVKMVYAKNEADTSERVVLPEALVYRGGCWYLSAFCTQAQDCRAFRFDRIQTVQNTHEKMVSKGCGVKVRKDGLFPPRALPICTPSLDAPPPIEYPYHYRYKDPDLNDACTQWRRALATFDRLKLLKLHANTPFVRDSVFQSNCLVYAIWHHRIFALHTLWHVFKFRGEFETPNALLCEMIHANWRKGIRYFLTTCSKEFDLNQKDNPFLISAAKYIHPNLLKELIKKFHADPNAQNRSGESVLQHFVQCDDEHDFDCEYEEPDPLFTHLDEPSLQCVDYLIKKCHVNVNTVNSQHKTPLFYAVQNKQVEKVKLLLAHGALPYEKLTKSLKSHEYSAHEDDNEEA